MGSVRVKAGSGAVVLALASVAAGQCPHEWSPDFGVPGATGGEVSVGASIVFDDGTGPALYIGGQFTSVDGVTGNGVARWDGTAWTIVNTGLAPTANPRAFAIHDDGTGPALYAAGSIMYVQDTVRSRVVKLTASGWAPLIGPSGTPGAVYALASFDPDGPGEAPAVLVAGGTFRAGTTAPWNRVAQWDGTDWSSLSTGIPDMKEGIAEVRSLGVYDEDGDGPAPARLFIGGMFEAAGTAPTPSIARWDGTEFSTVGTGFPTFATIVCMSVFDDGSGVSLFAAGAMGTRAGMKWNGQTWTRVDRSADGVVFVFDLEPFDPDGAGPEPETLVFAGVFNYIGATYFVHNIARWDGERFLSVGGGFPNDSLGVYTLAAVQFNGVPSLFAGGNFEMADGNPSRRIALWTESVNPADWNDSGEVNSQDFFDFLVDFFDFNADFNADGLMNSQDFFDFLDVFFNGC